MGFNQTWILLNNVLPVAKEKYGGFDPEAIRKAALDVDIPPGGTIQGYGVKFYRPGTPLSGQNERSTPVVMQNAGEHISVVWPTNIRTQDPVFRCRNHRCMRCKVSWSPRRKYIASPPRLRGHAN
jgi:branched-chain amino acid transport system substrate-binding protein